MIYTDKPFSVAKTWSGNRLVKDSLEIKVNHAGAIIGFKTAKGEKVGLKVASSFISFEQAELNLKRELGNDNFETVKSKAKAVWNKS